MKLFSKQTQITSSIDAITSLNVISDWAAVAQLCEQVNAKDDGAKEAAKALRKKLRYGRPQQQMNAISLIQAMINGCGAKFKAQMATAKFAEDIEAVAISEATDVNVKIQLMESLEEWAAIFSTEPGLTIIPQLYNTLVRNNTPRRRNASPISSSPQQHFMSPEQRMRQMAQDIELARNNAHMLTEAVSFCDPDTEAIEENELIKEFHAKCMSLQRGIQHYLSEITESANPNEDWLTSLLACNQELVQAFNVYNQMMDRQQMQRIQRASTMTDVVSNAPGAAVIMEGNGKRRSPSPEQTGSAYAGVGGNATSNGHTNGYPATTTAAPQRSTPPSSQTQQAWQHQQQAQVVPSSHDVAAPEENPFADEPYFVTGPADVAAAVKMGKRPDNSHNESKLFDASEYFRQQQLEQAQLQKIKEEQDRLQREAEGYMGTSQSGSSSSAAIATAATAASASSSGSHA
ncbi:putative actin patch assembly and actin polymerization protein [Actinomortierella wolfii]|nr:putative actin patch assembly and actin polymerization protein [Actinomortierella wolfii]